MTARLITSDGEYVRVLPDLRFPRRVEAVDTGDADDLYSTSLVAEWSEAYIGYEIVSLTLEKRLEAITTAGLRSVAVQSLFRDAAQSLALTDDGEQLIVPGTEELIEQTRKDEDARSLWVARIYVLARAQDEPPLVRVAAAFDVSQSTATRMVYKAREAGLI